MTDISVNAEIREKNNSYRGKITVKNNTKVLINNWNIICELTVGSSITECKNFQIIENKLLPNEKINKLKPNSERNFRIKGIGKKPISFKVIIEEPFPVPNPDPKPPNLNPNPNLPNPNLPNPNLPNPNLPNPNLPNPNLPGELPNPVQGNIPIIPLNAIKLDISQLKPLLVNDKKNTEWNIIKVGHGKSEKLHEIIDFQGSQVLRIIYPKDSFKPSAEPEGGIGFYASPKLFPTNEIILHYEMYFEDNFDPQLGGKLPGIFLGPPGASGGRKSNGNASCRLMWRTFANPYIKAKMETLNNKKIRIQMPTDNELKEIKNNCMIDGNIECEAYVYCSANQDPSYYKIDGYIGNPTFGDSLWRGYAKMKKKTWNKIFIHIKMNTFTNNKANTDGILNLNINGYSFNFDKIKWTENICQIEGIAFDTFFGGGSDIYATPIDTSIYFKNITIFN